VCVMSRFDDIQQFVQQASRVTDSNELQDLIGSAVRALGFDHYALVNHIRPSKSREPAVRLHDFPDGWAEIFRERGYFHEDPVMIACQKSASPFTWADVPMMVDLTARQKEVLDASKAAGFSNGLIVPIHVPGKSTASCTFSVREGREIPENSFPAAQYFGCFAFEAARRLAARTSAKKNGRVLLTNKPRFTKRQLDCLVLAGQGKSDRDVAQILGISDQTVHQHMEDAKRKYEVATRMQLVVRALFDNHVAFADLVH
jgi:LuxR family quorum-sensing system transcriptional regulator CciR